MKNEMLTNDLINFDTLLKNISFKLKILSMKKLSRKKCFYLISLYEFAEERYALCTRSKIIKDSTRLLQQFLVKIDRKVTRKRCTYLSAEANVIA